MFLTKGIMNLCFKSKVELKFIYKIQLPLPKSHIYTPARQKCSLIPLASGVIWVLEKKTPRGYQDIERTTQVAHWGSILLAFGASSSVLQARCSQSRKVEWLISFLLLLSDTSTIEAFPQTRPPLAGGALVCATARGRALGTIPGKSHSELPHCWEHCCGIPALSPWAAQQPEHTALELLSGLCLWVCGTSGTSLSSSGLPSST